MHFMPTFFTTLTATDSILEHDHVTGPHVKLLNSPPEDSRAFLANGYIITGENNREPSAQSVLFRHSLDSRFRSAGVHGHWNRCGFCKV
jgi:hypothetical protein